MSLSVLARDLLLAVCLLPAVIGMSAVHAQAEPRFLVTGYAIEGENPLGAQETRALLAPYTGEAVTLDGLQNAAAALEEAIKARGFGFMRVVLPAQSAQGVIALRVLAFRLGEVTVSGNRHFGTANIRASLPSLRIGESPNLRSLARNQSHANEHPSKRVEVTMRQGVAPDTVDAAVKVEDADPLQWFSTLNNSGAGTTGRWRLGFGATHSNLFDRDHALTATWSTSPGHWSQVKQYGLYYRAPFYAQGGTLSAYFTRSDSNSGTVAQFFQVSGRGEFMGLRWSQRLQPVGAWSHGFDVGVEDRLFVNNVLFSGTPLGVDVRSRPLILRHEGRLDGAGYRVGHALEFAHNLGGGSANTAAGYTGNRAGAPRDWNALRIALDGNLALGEWIAAARLRGQWSGDALIPGEQFGLGGASLVRGLEEREGTGDSGVVANVELISPVLAEGLRALAFVDAGRARLRAAGGAAAAVRHAASAGAGVRWQWNKQLSLSMDWARVFDAGGGLRHGDERLHLSLAVKF